MTIKKERMLLMSRTCPEGSGSPGSDMTAAGSLSSDEIVDIIVQKWPSSRPCSMLPSKVTLRNGQSLMFNAPAALETLAAAWNGANGPSDRNKERLKELRWGVDWIESAVEKRGRVNRSRKVPKSVKIQLLRIYYPEEPPSWKDEIPVSLEDNTLWVFKPVEWLDDVSNNWLGGRASVMLTSEERLAMEKMQWVKPWLKRVEQKREARRKRKCPDDSDPGMCVL